MLALILPLSLLVLIAIGIYFAVRNNKDEETVEPNSPDATATTPTSPPAPAGWKAKMDGYWCKAKSSPSILWGLGVFAMLIALSMLSPAIRGWVASNLTEIVVAVVALVALSMLSSYESEDKDGKYVQKDVPGAKFLRFAVIATAFGVLFFTTPPGKWVAETSLGKWVVKVVTGSDTGLTPPPAPIKLSSGKWKVFLSSETESGGHREILPPPKCCFIYKVTLNGVPVMYSAESGLDKNPPATVMVDGVTVKVTLRGGKLSGGDTILATTTEEGPNEMIFAKTKK